jgi:hypothetical protein
MSTVRSVGSSLEPVDETVNGRLLRAERTRETQSYERIASDGRGLDSSTGMHSTIGPTDRLVGRFGSH